MPAARGVPAFRGGCLVWGEGVCSGGVPAPGEGGLLGGLMETPPDGYCCGRYASYWNAFLFIYQNKIPLSTKFEMPLQLQF